MKNLRPFNMLFFSALELPLFESQEQVFRSFQSPVNKTNLFKLETPLFKYSAAVQELIYVCFPTGKSFPAYILEGIFLKSVFFCIKLNTHILIQNYLHNYTVTSAKISHYLRTFFQLSQVRLELLLRYVKVVCFVS